MAAPSSSSGYAPTASWPNSHRRVAQTLPKPIRIDGCGGSPASRTTAAVATLLEPNVVFVGTELRRLDLSALRSYPAPWNRAWREARGRCLARERQARPAPIPTSDTRVSRCSNAKWLRSVAVPTDRTIPFDGHEIAIRDWGGSGSAMVLLPGGGRNLTDWELVVPRLHEGHHVVGVDLPGHGGSSEPEAWDWDLAVSFVERAVAALNLINPLVVGHSMGGMVAARYGMRHPEAPGVVNVDGHGLGGPSVPQSFHDERARLLEQMQEQPADSGDQEWLDGVLGAMRPRVEALGVPWSAAKPALMRSYVQTVDGRWQRRPSNRFIASFPPETGPDLFDIYRAVKCPLLIFNCTGGDASMPAEMVAAYRAALATDLASLRDDAPGIDVVEVDAGHMVMLQQPDATADHILSFASRHAVSG